MFTINLTDRAGYCDTESTDAILHLNKLKTVQIYLYCFDTARVLSTIFFFGVE
jgi:hypothetical protein